MVVHEGLTGKMNLPTGVLSSLQQEPREALEGGSDGLEAIRLIIKQASDHMVSGGWLLFEIGHGQWAAVDELISGVKTYSDWAVIKDYSGHDRVVRAKAMTDKD